MPNYYKIIIGDDPIFVLSAPDFIELEHIVKLFNLYDINRVKSATQEEFNNCLAPEIRVRVTNGDNNDKI